MCAQERVSCGNVTVSGQIYPECPRATCCPVGRIDSQVVQQCSTMSGQYSCWLSVTIQWLEVKRTSTAVSIDEWVITPVYPILPLPAIVAPVVAVGSRADSRHISLTVRFIVHTTTTHTTPDRIVAIATTSIELKLVVWAIINDPIPEVHIQSIVEPGNRTVLRRIAGVVVYLALVPATAPPIRPAKPAG